MIIRTVLCSLLTVGLVHADRFTFLKEPVLPDSFPEIDVTVEVPVKRLLELREALDAMAKTGNQLQRERDEAQEQLFKRIGQCT